MDVLKGGVELANSYEPMEQRAGAVNDGDHGEVSKGEGEASAQGGCQNLQQSLADLACMEKQLVVDLRRFMAEVGARVEGAMAGPEMWGLWWDSHLEDVSEAVEESAKYFEAAGDR